MDKGDLHGYRTDRYSHFNFPSTKVYGFFLIDTGRQYFEFSPMPLDPTHWNEKFLHAQSSQEVIPQHQLMLALSEIACSFVNNSFDEQQPLAYWFVLIQN